MIKPMSEQRGRHAAACRQIAGNGRQHQSTTSVVARCKMGVAQRRISVQTNRTGVRTSAFGSSERAASGPLRLGWAAPFSPLAAEALT